MTWELSIAGLLVGALVGLTGVGGGSLMTPALVFLFGFNPTVAIGTDILHGAIFKSVGAVHHRTLGTVHARLGGWMFVASAPMSLVGVGIATWLRRTHGDATESMMAVFLGAALVAGALGLLAKSFVRHMERPDGQFELEKRHRWAAITIGFFGGLIVGMTSVGTGVFFALTLLVLFPLRTALVVGTDIFHAAALLWVAGIGHWVAGNVDVSAVGWLLVGSVPGVLIGSQYTVRLPDRSVRIVLATVLLLAGMSLLGAPSAAIVLVLILTMGLAVITFSPARRWLPGRRPRQAIEPEKTIDPAAPRVL